MILYGLEIKIQANDRWVPYSNLVTSRDETIKFAIILSANSNVSAVRICTVERTDEIIKTEDVSKFLISLAT